MDIVQYPCSIEYDTLYTPNSIVQNCPPPKKSMDIWKRMYRKWWSDIKWTLNSAEIIDYKLSLDSTQIFITKEICPPVELIIVVDTAINKSIVNQRIAVQQFGISAGCDYIPIRDISDSLIGEKLLVSAFRTEKKITNYTTVYIPPFKAEYFMCNTNGCKNISLFSKYDFKNDTTKLEDLEQLILIRQELAFIVQEKNPHKKFKHIKELLNHPFYRESSKNRNLFLMMNSPDGYRDSINVLLDFKK